MAPNRIATARANARYARPKTTGWAARSVRSRPIHAVAAMAIVPATTVARRTRIPTVAPTRPPIGARVTSAPKPPPAVAARTAIRGVGQ